MNSIVDSIRTLLLGKLGNAELILASTLLSCDASLKIALGITQNLTQQLCKARCMVSLLERIALVSLCNLWITLAVCLASHCKIHTYLATLTCKVILQSLDDLLIDAIFMCLTENVYCSECQIIIHCIFHLLELAGWCLANRALLWCLCTLVDVTTNGANKFLLHNVNVLKCSCIVLSYYY